MNSLCLAEVLAPLYSEEPGAAVSCFAGSRYEVKSLLLAEAYARLPRVPATGPSRRDGARSR